MSDDKIKDSLMLASGVIEHDGKYAAIVRIGGITQYENALELADWATETIHRGFTGPNPLPRGTVLKITSVED